MTTMFRGRKTLITLDDGGWCFARLVGRQRRESGLRVELVRPAASKLPTFTVAAPNCGIGFAL
ncbi:hypothetical protein J2X34_000806 [Rhodococcus sp. BE178]